MNQARVNSSKSRIGQSVADWVAANLHVIVVFSVLVGGWVANWAMMSIRINDNTERIGKLEQRFDRDVVPRQEQEVRDRCSTSAWSRCSAASTRSNRNCAIAAPIASGAIMANFDEALAVVLRHEDPKLSGTVTEDCGGRTRFGIAERSHPDLRDEFYCGFKEKALAKAREIYRRDYWDAIRGDEISNQQVAGKLLDMAVNMGVRQAAVLCQRAVSVVLAISVMENAVIGAKTISAINSCDPQSLIDRLREDSAGFYRHIASVRPEATQYLRGWLARAKA